MKYLLLLLSFISTRDSYAQSDTLNRKDELGRKQGHWIYYGSDRPEALVTINGKVEEGDYLNDRKEGFWIKYHSDGMTPKLIGMYAQNRPKGEYEKFHENGRLKEIGYFKKNLYHDTLRRYFDNGSLEYIAYYDSLGKTSGIVQYFYPNKQLEFTYKSESGRVLDSTIRYYMNGDLKMIKYYDHSNLVTDSIIFAPVHPMIDYNDNPQQDSSRKYQIELMSNTELISGKLTQSDLEVRIPDSRLIDRKVVDHNKSGEFASIIYYIRGKAYTVFPFRKPIMPKKDGKT